MAGGGDGKRKLGRLFTGGTWAHGLLAAAFVILLQAEKQRLLVTLEKMRVCAS